MRIKQIVTIIFLQDAFHVYYAQLSYSPSNSYSKMNEWINKKIDKRKHTAVIF